MDENGVPAPASRGIAGRLRTTANRVISESIPLTAGDGHGNGHGNGHALPGGNGERGDEATERTAVGAAPQVPQAADQEETAPGPEPPGPPPGESGS